MDSRDTSGASETGGRKRRAESAGTSRRRFLQSAGVTAGIASLAGCTDFLSGESDEPGNNTTTTSDFGQIGSGRTGDQIQGGTSMQDMPDLSGEITVYSGRGEALVGELISYIEGLYPDLTIQPRYEGSSQLVQKILNEGENSPADVFFSVNAGSLGFLKDEGRTVELSDEITGMVREEFHDPDGNWVGTSGRARTIPYNTDTFSESDIPTDIMAFPDADQFSDDIGWAPSYGSFQAFVTAMRILNGREATKQWLEGMIELGVQEYTDEFAIALAVADGEISAGFTNHYYIQRVLADREDAPLATAFTEGDAGAIFNVAGAAVVDTAQDQEMAANFVRHLLSAEAQAYFATTTYEYPLIPEVEPIGDLPTIDELNPPADLDLTQLSDIRPTLDLMREVGISV
ncbi:MULTISPECIES: extracellular solute-binding protein [unclassified Haladaptatus]|uniref:extracellular solute-binding protein n=1 Tax=unclassified Haladaptatus TaxID=2622732 RepID=UPI0023E86654|nr:MULTISPECIES: extracellular solute-binding protein [unclassified Haladaptatus]